MCQKPVFREQTDTARRRQRGKVAVDALRAGKGSLSRFFGVKE